MKKAVFTTGGKQYLVSEGDEIDIELLKSDDKSVSFDTLLVIDGETTHIGSPIVDKIKVIADVLEANIKADKVTAIRYKPKKRVHKVRGHRQQHSRIKVTKIA
jgi:large subunit ribosomal protein L21